MSEQLSLFGSNEAEEGQDAILHLLADVIAHDASTAYKPRRGHPLYSLFRETKQVIKTNDAERAHRILTFLLDNTECGVRTGHKRAPSVERLYRRGCALLNREPQENRVPDT